MLDSCVFCSLDQSRIIEENDHFVAIRDGYPVTPLHSLIISKRHVQSYFQLSSEELVSLNSLLTSQRDSIIQSDNSVSGFNVGINDGPTAGQTIFHLHIHLIPRRAGDMENPAGGVRGVIPEKMKY